MNCILLTSDIIDSKKIANLDSLLKIKIKELNLELKNHLLTSVSSSRGDEIQFILKFDEHFFKNIILFRTILYPIAIRTGASILDIAELNLKNSNLTNPWNLNGEPFFSARKILDEELKKVKKSSIKFNSKLKKYDNILNSFFTFNDIILNSWKDTHWELAKLFFKYPNDNKEISKKLGLYSITSGKPKQTYYDRLSKTNLSAIKESSEYLINEFFNEEVL